MVGWDLYEKSGITADRMVEFIQTHISGKYKNKLIILDNTSSHRNPKVKEIINKEKFIICCSISTFYKFYRKLL